MKNNLIYLFILFISHNLFAKESGFDLPLPKDVKAELILEYPKEPEEFLTSDIAMKICAQYQALFEEKYFYVFCKFNWIEFEKENYGLVSKKKWKYLGTEVTQHHNYWGHFTGKKPIWRTELVSKKELISITEHKKLALAIWGIGNLDTQEWKSIYPKVLADGSQRFMTFIKEGEAVLSCEEVLSELINKNKNRLKYDRAQCVISYSKEAQGYIFEIKTQNPFL